MKTHHCIHCQILIFVCKNNEYARHLREACVEKIYTLNVRELNNGNLVCERCNYAIGIKIDEINYVFALNKFIIYTIGNQ